jgi:hypothetical protein
MTIRAAPAVGVPSNEDYLKAIARAAQALHNQRLLLAEDVERIVKAAAAREDK